MSITEARARRALRHAGIPWDREVEDPREDAWVVHDHVGLLGGLAAAFSIGCGAEEIRGRAREREPADGSR